MPDREKVIAEIEDALSDDLAKAYVYGMSLNELKDKALKDAVAILKEQKNPDKAQDSTGNNGPLRRIATEDVVAGLIKLANGGILADAATLLYLLGDEEFNEL